jgi:hypothetical protein
MVHPYSLFKQIPLSILQKNMQLKVLRVVALVFATLAEAAPWLAMTSPTRVKFLTIITSTPGNFREEGKNVAKKS